MKRMISTTIMALAIGTLFALPGYAALIQIQPSSDGNFEASLISAKTRKEVLTVKVKLKNVASKSAKILIHYKDVYFLDIENKKKYFALKDSEEKYIAGPIDRRSEGGQLSRFIDSDGQVIFWVKLPAPPETIKTVDIFFPSILPFEEIEIKR